MKINFDLKPWKGKQPVKVLEDKLDDYSNQVLLNLNLFKYKTAIKYSYIEEEIKTGPIADTNKEIHIEESFQSFIWIWSYALMVIYDEGVAKPRLGQSFSKEKVERAFKLLDYGYSLLNSYEPWDLSLPNPQIYDISDSFYVERANGIYLFAMNEIFLHEIGHIDNGDIDKLIRVGKGEYNLTLTERKQWELNADEFAFSKLFDGYKNPVYKKTIEFGIISGFSALIIIQSTLRDYSGNYPDADERYRLAIESIGLDEQDNLWGMACLSWKLWSEKNSRDLEWAKEYETYKELFEATLKKVSDFK